MATIEEAREAARKARAARAARKDAQRVVADGTLQVRRPPDPGRSQLAVEWMTAAGKTVLTLPTESSETWLQVDAIPTAGLDMKPPCADELVQEWRVLRFCGHGCGNIIQSVVKVWVPPYRDRETSEQDLGIEPIRVLPAAVLPFPYTRTFVTLVTSALHALGIPLLTSRLDKIRMLCVGLGGGSIPTYLTETFPNCHVDVAEIEPAVLQAAKEGMGFREHSRLCVFIQDGADFALNSVSSVERNSVYDAVLVDAMDEAGVIPPSLLRSNGGLVKALANGLLREQGGVIAINMFRGSDPSPIMKAYSSALAKGNSGLGLGSSCAAVAEGTNNVLAMTTCGPCCQPVQGIAHLRERLNSAAREIGEATACPFDMAALLGHNIHLI